MPNEVVRILQLPFEALSTLYREASEVRLYRHALTGQYEVGKLVDSLGLEGSMLVREATWLSEIRHDNIVRLKTVADVNDPKYPPPMRMIEMVMPYYERGSIADALAQGERFTPAQARDHALAVLAGLAELHEVRRVLHRDIKSSNILLTGDVHLACISDLGISVPMDSDGTGEAFPAAQAYSPPEAFSTNRVDKRSDIYSLGLVLFELANGPLPLSLYMDRLEMAKRLGDGKPALLPKHLRLGPHVPPGMRRLINKAIAADPSKRPQSAADMANELAKVALVDWHVLDERSSSMIWEGGSALAPGRVFRIEATRSNAKTWKLRGLQKKRAWRRALPDQTVVSLADRDTQKFFDQMVVAATSR